MEIKLFESELKVMNIIWKHNEISASDLSKIMNKEESWNKNTTYTVIQKLIKKNAIERIEPKFICRALISKEQIQLFETTNLIDKMYEGSKKMFFSTFLKNEVFSEDDIEDLKKCLDDLE
ncbi:MAG: BlaI/MecI/CopY family transcriptional regulator [Sebaldella sp.]|nr:BlaI/MecI/CopY family transcriptional regulator [Sebaldella sp.]